MVPSANLDELRISTNWADVTPPVWSMPDRQHYYESNERNPASEELMRGFYVKAANSTAPTYQWQISQNSGTTWSNINGARPDHLHHPQFAVSGG